MILSLGLIPVSTQEIVCMPPQEIVCMAEPFKVDYKAINPVQMRKEPEVSRNISRPEPIERTMLVTAYTKDDEGMDGRGITTSGEPAKEGITIAAPLEIPFGTQIYIPELDHVYTVTDRGGAIKGNRLDIFMNSKASALAFGPQVLTVYLRFPD